MLLFANKTIQKTNRNEIELFLFIIRKNKISQNYFSKMLMYTATKYIIIAKKLIFKQSTHISQLLQCQK